LGIPGDKRRQNGEKIKQQYSFVIARVCRKTQKKKKTTMESGEVSNLSHSFKEKSSRPTRTTCQKVTEDQGKWLLWVEKKKKKTENSHKSKNYPGYNFQRKNHPAATWEKKEC